MQLVMQMNDEVTELDMSQWMIDQAMIFSNDKY